MNLKVLNVDTCTICLNLISRVTVSNGNPLNIFEWEF